MSFRSMTKWDQRFMDEARLVATWSRDPSTKCGCVIVDSLHRQQSQGFNGFPRGVQDLDERYNDRPTKYAMIVHAEANAIVTARKDLSGCRLYTTKFPCSSCTKLIIQAGIAEVICPVTDPKSASDQRWMEDAKFSEIMLEEAGVVIIRVTDTIVPGVDSRYAGLVDRVLYCATCGGFEKDLIHCEPYDGSRHVFQPR